MNGHFKIINGIAVFMDYPDGYGEAVVKGRTWRWHFHRYCGPLWLRKDGEHLKNQRPPKAVWRAFDKWLKKLK